jgi:hypothetical protein
MPLLAKRNTIVKSWAGLSALCSADQKIPSPVHRNAYYFSRFVSEKQIAFFISIKE